jgi:hypothetical protein
MTALFLLGSTSCVKKKEDARPDALESSSARGWDGQVVDRFYLAVPTSPERFEFAEKDDPERIGENVIYGIACYNEPADPAATESFGTSFEIPLDTSPMEHHFFRSPVKKRFDERLYVHEFVASWKSKANPSLSSSPTCEIVFGTSPKPEFKDAVVATPPPHALKDHKIYQEAIFSFTSGCLAVGLSGLVTGGLIAGAVASQGLVVGLGSIGGGVLATNAAATLSNALWCGGGLLGITRNAALEASEAAVLFSTAVHNATEATQAQILRDYAPIPREALREANFEPLTSAHVAALKDRNAALNESIARISDSHEPLRKMLADPRRHPQAAAYYNKLFVRNFNKLQSKDVSRSADVHITKILGRGAFGMGIGWKELFSRHHISSGVFFEKMKRFELKLEQVVDETLLRVPPARR